MNDNNILTEFCGLCCEREKPSVHDIPKWVFTCDVCGKTATRLVHPDFLTPDGYNLLHEEMRKRGLWDAFGLWLAFKEGYTDCTPIMAEAYFHRLPVHEKAPILAEFIKTLKEEK